MKKYRMFAIRPTALLASFIAICSSAHAADPFSPASVETPSGWIVTFKGNVIAGPKYPGSDQISVIGFPSLSFRRAGTTPSFSTPDDGISIGIVETPVFRFGPVARFQGGRYDGDHRELRGIRDVDWTIEGGFFAEYWPIQDRLRTRVEVRRGFGGHEGFVATLAADLVSRFDQWTVAAGPRMNLGDSEFADTYFGVSAQDAAWNGQVTPFNANGGITSFGLAASATYQWNPAWATTVYAGYERLVGDAADSPIVRSFGSADQFKLGASFSYSFQTSGF